MTVAVCRFCICHKMKLFLHRLYNVHGPKLISRCPFHSKKGSQTPATICAKNVMFSRSGHSSHHESFMSYTDACLPFLKKCSFIFCSFVVLSFVVDVNELFTKWVCHSTLHEYEQQTIVLNGTRLRDIIKFWSRMDFSRWNDIHFQVHRVCMRRQWRFFFYLSIFSSSLPNCFLLYFILHKCTRQS